MIAALYVLPDGPYAGLPDVDVWDEIRDARLYAGPNPVVAHPPCARWGRYWYGGPMTKERKKLGDDGGCFAAAIAAVREWGGVLEHPAHSYAWLHFGLKEPPRAGGWVVADWEGGWTCCVDQEHYGHRAQKATWLYVHGVPNLPSLKWGKGRSKVHVSATGAARRRERYIQSGVLENLSHRQRLITPEPFRDMLLSIARGARP